MQEIAAVASRVAEFTELTERPSGDFAALLRRQAGPTPPAPPTGPAGPAGPTPPTGPQAQPATTPTTIPSATLGEMLQRQVSTLPWSPPAATAAAASAAVGAVGAPAAAPPAAGADRSGMLMPVDGRISSNYGPRVHPITGQSRMHHGIDIAASSGTPIRAALAGTVTYSGPMGGYGNIVIIEHPNGTETRYAHNSRNDVNVGQQVARGEVVGAVGSTGMSTGPHLHFEVRRNGESVDPAPYLR
jgi:murein DD-endopeptidase MepM/ murein hydrolase activator NlpD